MIRNLYDYVKMRVHICAAKNPRSLGKEERIILRNSVDDGQACPKDLVQFTRECFQSIGGVEIDLPPRGPMREPPDFS